MLEDLDHGHADVVAYVGVACTQMSPYIEVAYIYLQAYLFITPL